MSLTQDNIAMTLGEFCGQTVIANFTANLIDYCLTFDLKQT